MEKIVFEANLELLLIACASSKTKYCHLIRWKYLTSWTTYFYKEYFFQKNHIMMKIARSASLILHRLTALLYDPMTVMQSSMIIIIIIQ